MHRVVGGPPLARRQDVLDGEPDEAPSIREPGPGELDDACDFDLDCRSTLVCRRGTCQETRFVPPGAECAVDGFPDYCAPGTVCLGDLGGRGVCARPLSRGDSCTGGPVCGPGLYCNQRTQGEAEAGQCRPLERAGGPCFMGDECEPGLLCDDDTERCGVRQPCPLPADG